MESEHNIKMEPVALEEFDDYEALPPSSTMSTHMLAGAAAGVMEHCIMYPLDCIKTRMQVLVPDPKANYRSIPDAMYRILRYEGIGGSVRGITAMMYGAGPAHAMYFACYEKLKKTLSTTGQSNHIVHGFSGCCATVLHDAVMNPADVVKQRMQVYGSPYKTSLQCLTQVYKAEGARAFYRSFTTQLTLNIPFQSLHFMVYEFCQDKINPDRQYNPLSHTFSGAMAGAIAAAATTPLDVCKTLLNTQERCAIAEGQRSIRGLSMAFRTVYRFQGIGGYFRGITARILYQMPSTAISWSVYEFFKFVLTARQTAAAADGSDNFNVRKVAASNVHVHAAADRT